MPRSPGFEDADEWPSESDGFEIEGDGSLDASEELWKYTQAQLDLGYGPAESISKQLRRSLELGYDPAEAVGQLKIVTDELPHWQFGSISNALTDYEAARLYVFRELTEHKDYRIAELLDDDDVRERLNLHTDVSEKTITRIAEIVKEQHARGVVTDIESVVRELDEASVGDDLLEPPEPVADGMDAPELVKLTRTVRATGYAPILLDRSDESQYDKWELFRPYELACHDNVHPNNARGSLQQKPFYWNRQPPTAKALWNQIRTASRGELRVMYLCAFEQFLDLLDRYGLIPNEPAFAVDLTGWPWFGAIDDEDTPEDEREQPGAVEGTKPGRNYSHSWQFATISLVDVPLPMTFAARSVEQRNRRAYHLNQLLNYAEAKFDTGRVFLDKDFYTGKIKDELKQRDQDFIITAPRNMGAFEDLIMGTELREDSWNSQAYEIGIGASEDADHYLFVNPSEKRLKRADTGLEDTSNWEAYYTNIDPETVEGGGAALAADYRLRWGIETAYRMLKHDFMPKSASPMRNQRVFLFNYAILLNNMWMAANVLAAANDQDYVPHEADGPLSVKDDQGNYLYTANEFMTALVDDFEPTRIGEVDDLSEKSDMVSDATDTDLPD